jgi:ribosomal protein L37AE/L43A
MRRTSLPSHATTRPGHLICPVCESGELYTRRLAPLLAGCDSCGGAFDDVVLGMLEQIVALADVVGKHACECGHPEMRRLPDSTFHCPACRSEVVPTESNPTPSSALRKEANKDDLTRIAEKGEQSKVS